MVNKSFVKYTTKHFFVKRKMEKNWMYANFFRYRQLERCYLAKSKTFMYALVKNQKGLIFRELCDIQKLH